MSYVGARLKFKYNNYLCVHKISFLLSVLGDDAKCTIDPIYFIPAASLWDLCSDVNL
jgi:hypothetical protein